MSKESDTLDLLRSVSARTVVEHLKAVHRAQTGDPCVLPRPCPPDDGLLTEFWFEAARVQLENYDRLLGLSEKFSGRLEDALRAWLRPGGAPRSSTPTLVELTGSAGKAAEGRLMVENRTGCAGRVDLLVGVFRPVGGTAEFSAPARIVLDNPTGELPPGGHASATVTVTLTGDFHAGYAYVADAVVRVAQQATSAIVLRVAVTA
jgi:hypothetical protein